MFPIVLVHGIANPNSLNELEIPFFGRIEIFPYFRGIESHLEKKGFGPFLQPVLDFASSSDTRAQTLKNQVEPFIEETGAEKVHIIAHSMGGLDSRRMIVNLGMADKIASLTTIGTPHLGTVLADHLVDKIGDPLIDDAKKFLNFDLSGGRDLTTEACKKFNDRVRDAEAKNKVFYQTYSSHPKESKLFGPFLKTYRSIRKLGGGENDALVPVESQAWTARLTAGDGTNKDVAQREFKFLADHLNQVGWRIGLNNREFSDKLNGVYLEIAQSIQ
jgi:triacylglycerol lipase